MPQAGFRLLYPSGIQPLSPLIVITYSRPLSSGPTPLLNSNWSHFTSSNPPNFSPLWNQSGFNQISSPLLTVPRIKKQHLSMIRRVTCDLAPSCPLHMPHAFKPESSQPLSLRASAHPSWIFLEHSSPFSMLN